MRVASLPYRAMGEDGKGCEVKGYAAQHLPSGFAFAKDADIALSPH